MTPVTSESFAKWRAERNDREMLAEEAAAKKKQDDFKKMKAGMKTGVTFSGKDLFDFNPEWAGGDADGEDNAMDEYIVAPSDEEDNNAELKDNDTEVTAGIMRIGITNA